jgi:restriction endonuclease Mrr
MLEGIITKLTDRGFGFIWSDLGEEAYFFHSKDLQGVTFDELHCGDALIFEPIATSMGPQAELVERLGKTLESATPHELPATTPVVAGAVQECTAELVEYLAKSPNGLHVIHPGTFENIVAAIFRHEGFVTERVSSWNQPDGGIDLIAVRPFEPGPNFKVVIQCKRWGQSRKVSAEPLRSLAGVLDRFEAHAGVVATTGFFSEEAKEEAARYLWRISLRDYDSILTSLKRLHLTH